MKQFVTCFFLALGLLAPVFYALPILVDEEKKDVPPPPTAVPAAADHHQQQQQQAHPDNNDQNKQINSNTNNDNHNNNAVNGAPASQNQAPAAQAHHAEQQQVHHETPHVEVHNNNNNKPHENQIHVPPKKVDHPEEPVHHEQQGHVEANNAHHEEEAVLEPDSEDEFFDDEDIDYEGYAEDEAEEKELEHEFDEEYQRYLDEMTDSMVQDPAFIEQIIKNVGSDEAAASQEQLDLLAIARRLKESAIRTELEEQERQLVERQRRMAHREQLQELDVNPHADDEDFGDMDANLWDQFEKNIAKIKKIAKKRADLLVNIDKDRRHAFVQHEMDREINFRKKMATANAEERERLQAEHQALLDRILQMHGHHPGARQQLEEVWRAEDGLDPSTFDPRTFFHLHDMTGDGYLDLKEIEAIFYREATDLHADVNGKVADPFIVAEEASRMREHYLAETDTDKDGMISMDEFIAMTKQPAFNKDEPWKPLNPMKEFTDAQLDDFRRREEELMRRRKENGEHIDPALAKLSIRRVKAIAQERLNQEKNPHPQV